MLAKAKAPVRVSFGACGDTNYYIDLIGWGNVINATIDLYSHCEIHERNDDKIVLRSLETGQVAEFSSPDEIEFGNRELNLMKAVAKHYGNKGIEVVTHTDAPMEAGLGGSAAHTVSMIKAFDQFNNVQRSQEDTARLAYHIERELLGVEGGYQDQWASSYGGMNYMEFTKAGIKVSPIKLIGKDLEFLESNTLLVFIPRDKKGEAVHFEQRKKGQESVYILSMKRENILRLKEAFERRRFDEVGSVFSFDWKIKKQLAPGISNPRIDEMYSAAMDAGALGGRFIGAGAGGSAIFFCPGKKDEVRASLEKLGAKEIRYKFERAHQQRDFRITIQERIKEHNSTVESILNNSDLIENVHNITNRIVECYKNDGKVVVFGNGGSAADAQHFVGELVNTFKITNRPMLNALALTVNTTVLTAIGNDSSFDNVFSRQIESLVDGRDVVIGISTSGKAANVLNALKKAKEKGATVVFFTGKDGGMIGQTCEKDGTIDISLKIPSVKTERIQEGHHLLGHIICELVENELYGRS